MLGGLLRSDQFPRWLVASALDTLVADASAGLAELSGGQFELTHDEGEFLVVDHADADARRPVKTLSGGETFQASLALALALSAQMSSLAAEGAARLDSIFLDEGFGTLDEANLDVVAEHAGEPRGPRRPDGRSHHPRAGVWPSGCRCASRCAAISARRGSSAKGDPRRRRDRRLHQCRAIGHHFWVTARRSSNAGWRSRPTGDLLEGVPVPTLTRSRRVPPRCAGTAGWHPRVDRRASAR